MGSEQIATLTFFHFHHLHHQWWAFKQMQEARSYLPHTRGLVFYKMLGSGGGNGFSVLPDFSTYALLGVWHDIQDTLNFFSNDPYYHQLKEHSTYQWTLQLKAIKVKGKWAGKQPFHLHAHTSSEGLIAVLTRATIHGRKLFSFWKHVPKVSRHLYQSQAGVLFSKGIGEAPFWQQATFSLWQSRQAMTDYAYRSGKHQEIMIKARELQWYKEELFAEFIPVAMSGSWPGLPDLPLPAMELVSSGAH